METLIPSPPQLLAQGLALTPRPTLMPENGYVIPKRFPVFCAVCMVPIRDMASLNKHRSNKRHYCSEYPTSYQKQGFVRKDFRKSWRREQLRLKTKKNVTASPTSLPTYATSRFSPAPVATSPPPKSPSTFDLHEMSTSPSEHSIASEDNGLGGRPSADSSIATADSESRMDDAQSASPIQPFSVCNGSLGGFYTYSKQHAFVENSTKNAAVNTDPVAVYDNRLTKSSTRLPTESLETPRRQASSMDFLSPFPVEKSEEDVRFFAQLRSYREQEFLTDVFLVVEERKVFAHKIVLSARSSFLKGIFDKCANSSSYGLRLDFGFTFDAFVIALDFMYGTLAKDKIHVHNAVDVKAVAVKLELEGLKNYSQRVLDTDFEVAGDAESLFNVEGVLADLSNICAEFTATALDNDQLAVLNVGRDVETFPSPIESTRAGNSEIGGAVDGNISTPNPHLDKDCEVGLKTEFLSSGGLSAIELDSLPFGDEFFDLLETPCRPSANLNTDNNTNNNNSTINNNASDNSFYSPDSFCTNLKKTQVKSLPCSSIKKSIKTINASGTNSKKGSISSSFKPLSTTQPQSTKEFTAMLSTQFSGKDPPLNKPYMNCIICNEAVTGRTKIEQWIKLCQHLAEKHKKVIDREILTKQFGIEDSAITSSVLETDSRRSPGVSSQSSLVIKAPLPDKTLVETAVDSDEKRPAAKAKLNRFLNQKTVLNSQLMVHVNKCSSSGEKKERYRCSYCAKEFESLTPTQRHLVVAHNVPLPGLKILMCTNCGNKDVDRVDNLSEAGPSKLCCVCKHNMIQMHD